MTINDMLLADLTIDKIIVNVRQSGKNGLSKYIIGKDVRPSKYAKFIRESEAGDIYKDHETNIIIIDKIIQFRQLPEKPQGKEMCVGVLEKEIPQELRDLQVMYLKPFGCGRSDEMHGYIFECEVDYWGGIAGECE